MKSGIKYFLFGLLIGFMVLILFVVAKGNKKKDIPEANQPIENLYWLAGEWVSLDEDGGKIIENWEISPDKELEGTGYYIKDTDTIFKEQLSIKTIHNAICYIATINQQGPILFTLVKRNLDQWTFRNSRHDFPQRIIYNKLNAESFTVKTEGRLITGLMDGEDFTFISKK